MIPPEPGRRIGAGGKASRLTGQGTFERVLRTGRRVEGLYLQLIFAPAARGEGRTGYIIGRKVMARAVDRNRIRRKLREVVRTLHDELAAVDVIIRVRRARNRGEQDVATVEARRLLVALAAPRP